MKEIRSQKSWKGSETNLKLVKSAQAASRDETTAEALSSISAGDLEEMRKLVEERGMAELHRHLVEKIDQWKRIPVNVAITGQSGAGSLPSRDKSVAII